MLLWSWLRDGVHEKLFSRRTFEFFQKFRINLTKNYFYSPIPDVRSLQNSNIWQTETKLPGINLREDQQLEQIEQMVSAYRDECQFPLEPTALPYVYSMHNGSYGWLCAYVYYSIVRHYRPRRIVELGAGRSTYIAAQAAVMNQSLGINTELVAVDPFPGPVLQQGFPGLSRVLPQKAEDLPLDFFAELEAGDILFIDSTHTVKIGGDVTYLFLEVLPRLKPGVLIHIHDIFWPHHYPKKFVLDRQYFWAEQYLLQAFLAFNDHFEILWAGSYLTEKFPEKIRSIFPVPAGLPDEAAMLKLGLHYSSNSFWMRKVK